MMRTHLPYLLAAAFTLLQASAMAQVDRNGNPVFNSEQRGTIRIKDADLVSNYYTLRNNIEDRGSSVYIADEPSLDQIAEAATRLPSDFHILVEEGEMICMVMVMDMEEGRRYFVLGPGGDQRVFPCTLEGAISENRAQEIIAVGYDPKASLSGKELRFNGTTYSVLSNADLMAGVEQLIRKEKLHERSKSADPKPTPAELREMILTETKPGGGLDFFSKEEDQSMEVIQVSPGVFSTKASLMLYKWGSQVERLNAGSLQEMLEIFARFKGRPLNAKEIDYISMGYRHELEK